MIKIEAWEDSSSIVVKYNIAFISYEKLVLQFEKEIKAGTLSDFFSSAKTKKEKRF